MKNQSGKLSVGFLYDDSLDRADGVSHQVKTLGKWLSDQGHNVCYLVGETKMTSWAGGNVYSLAKNWMVKFNGNKVATPLPANTKEIKRILAMEQLDVVHVQMPYSPFMAQRVLNRLPKNVGVVGTFHILPASTAASVGTKLLRILYGRSLKRINKYLATSSPAAIFAQKSLGKKFEIVPNTVDIKQLRVAVPVNKPAHIVFLGRLVPRKGSAQLLKAFAILKANLPEASLTIAGDGPLRTQLEDFVKNNNLTDSVEFLGFINEADKPKILSTATIACFPSLGGESFGIVLVEAMAAGAGVVIGGNNPGYATVLGKNSDTLVEPSDSKEFATKLEKYLTNKDLVTKEHDLQQQNVKQYDAAIVGRQLVQIYQQAIASQSQKT